MLCRTLFAILAAGVAADDRFGIQIAGGRSAFNCTGSEPVVHFGAPITLGMGNSFFKVRRDFTRKHTAFTPFLYTARAVVLQQLEHAHGLGQQRPWRH
jgi:hypothetical protein